VESYFKMKEMEMVDLYSVTFQMEMMGMMEFYRCCSTVALRYRLYLRHNNNKKLKNGFKSN
jgi:hypothetical protein